MREHHESQGEKADMPEINVKIPKERLAFEHAMMMFRPDYLHRAARAVVGKMWLVGRNDSPDPFFTSDDPFVLHAHVQTIFGGAGLESPGVEIQFPLTPKYVLILVDRGHFMPLVGNQDGKVIPVTTETADFCKCLQIWSSRRQIYCSEDKFDYVRNYGEENPEIYDIERSRFSFR
jgi:hypothetical protein